MNLKLSSTKAIAAVAAGMLAGMALPAPVAEAGMRIHFGFPIGSFHAHGGGHHRHVHKYHGGRHHARRRARAIEAARARETAAAAARAEKRRAAAQAATAEARRKAAAQRAANEARLANIPLPVKKADLPAKATETAALDTAAITTTSGTRSADEAPVKLECKRYFANVGMTITVPCSE